MHTNHMLHVHHMFAGKFMHVVNIFIFTTRLYIFKQVKNWNFFLAKLDRLIKFDAFIHYRFSRQFNS